MKERKIKRQQRRLKRKEKRKKTREEFKKFIFRGNIIDLAVAVAVGSAFTAIVNSFVKDIIGGIMGYLMADMNLSELKIVLGNGEDAPAIKYGSFFETIIYFVIVAFVMFCVIKLMARINSALSKLDKKKEEEEKLKQEETRKIEEDKKKQEAIKSMEAEKNKAQKENEELALLREIRDLLKENK